MNELSKKRKQFRLEIRRQQCDKIFFSMRTTMLQISCSESFISHYTHLIQQNHSASQIISSMNKDIKISQESIKNVLSQATMHILMTKKFQFWQAADIQDLSQLFQIMFPRLEQEMKKLKYWQPFIELLTAAIIERWLHEKNINEKVYQTVIEMSNFASDYQEYYYKTFEEQIQGVLMQRQHLQNDQTLSILLIALKLTPYNLLNTKSKRILYQIAKRSYHRNNQISNSWKKDQSKSYIEFILVVLQKKGIEPQEKHLFWEIIEKANVNKQNYKQILRVLKFQSYQNDWINYDQSIGTLRIIYRLLRTTQDKCSFLKTIRSIIINELCNHQTIYNIYVQFFQSKLEVYLQHKSLIGIFSKIVYYLTYPTQLPFQQELISCVQNLMLYHKNKLEEKTRKRFICWLASKQKFQYNMLVSVLTEEEISEFFADLENNQRDFSIEV